MTKAKNEKNNYIYITLDRPRYIRFGHKALKQLFALTGKKLANLNSDDFDLAELEKIMFCGLMSDAKENGETLKLEDMEDLLDHAKNFNEIVDAMNKALEMAFQDTEKQKN